MKDLKLNDYDCMEDIIEEILDTICNIKTYSIITVQNSDEEFVCGSINIVRKGKNKHCLSHKYSDGTWHEAEISDSYRYAQYYKVSDLENLLPRLSRKNYNNDFLN